MTDLPNESVEGLDHSLDQILDEITERLRGGECLDLEDYITRFPGHADRLRQLLPAMQMLAEFGDSKTHGEALPVGPRETADSLGVLGDFRILREIGRGGMGIVYEAEQISLGRLVALKVLPFSALMDRRHVRRFKNEAQAAAALHHPHIVPVFSVGRERGMHYYAMQYIEGQTLAQLIRQLQIASPALDTEPKRLAAQDDQQTKSLAALTTQWSSGNPEYFRTVARFGKQVAEAVHFAHEEGIVHRDIKPSNILVDDLGHTWIADFGLAQVHGDGQLTMTGDLLGTLRYMSPEQAAGSKLLDHRTDVYSLGVTLYEMATLRAPFSADNRQELLRQVADDPPGRPRQGNRLVPTDLETIILKSMAKEPEGRFQTAKDLAEDLQRFLDRKPIRARPARRTERLRRWVRRRPMVAKLLMIIGVFVAVLAIGGPIVAVKYARMAAREDDSRRKLQEMLDRSMTWTAEALKSMGPLQRQLIEDTLSYYEDLRERRGTEPGIRFEVAVAYTRLGFVHALGDQDAKALQLYHAAVSLLTELSRQFPSDARYRFELADAHEFIGNHLPSEEGLPHFDRAIRLAQALTVTSPNEPVFRRSLGYARAQYAGCLGELGRLHEAESQLKHSIAIWRALIERFGRREDDLAGLAYGLYQFGAHYLQSQRFEASRRCMEEAVEIADQLDDYLPRKPEGVGGLTEAYNYYGRLLCCLRRPAEAERFFRQGISMANQCLSDFPHFKWGRHNLAYCHANLSTALVTLGREAEALATLRESMGQWQQLVDSNPTASNRQVQLSWTQFRLGQLLWQTGHRSEAKGHLRQSLRRLERLVAGPSRSLTGNRHLAYVLTSCRDVSLRDAARAVTCAEAALLAETADSWQMLGWACCQARQWERGIRAIETSNELSEGGDAFNWLLLAKIHCQQGQREEASRWYQLAIDAIDSDKPICFCDTVGPLDLRDMREQVGSLMQETPTSAK